MRSELAGGDVIAVNRLNDGSTVVLIADVSAKGAEANAYASWLASVFQIASAFASRPSAILKQLNTMLEHAFYDKDAGLFASAFVFRIIPEAALMVYASAGAQPPLLVRNSVVREPLQGGGQVLGVERSITHEDRVVRLCAGDAFVVFTDGITPGSVSSAVQASMFGSTATCDTIFTEIDRLTGGVYFDDATLLLANVRAA
jgi:sigma-B regulation protein RsbU (phosphoserine phosphatase)